MRTTLYTVLCVAIRLSAALMALRIIGSAPALFFSYSPGLDEDIFWIGIALNVAGLLLALALWLWPNLLAWWAIKRSQHQVLETSITASQLQHIALSVAGVWVFITGLSGFLARILVLLMMRHDAAANDLYAMTVPSSQWGGVAGYAVTAILGAVLALGSGGLVGLFQRLRHYPLDVETKRFHDASHTQDG